MIKYAHKINGVTSFNVTKLDVMTGFDELKICTHYTLDGRELDGFNSWPGQQLRTYTKD